MVFLTMVFLTMVFLPDGTARRPGSFHEATENKKISSRPPSRDKLRTRLHSNDDGDGWTRFSSAGSFGKSEKRTRKSCKIAEASSSYELDRNVSCKLKFLGESAALQILSKVRRKNSEKSTTWPCAHPS